jgi:CelD/BcsL family acetyltransferase involved in cellulose biosynthesis
VSSLQLVHLESIEDLRRAASAWDDLWQRSEVALPTARAELLAQWVEQFAPAARFHAVAVESEGRLLAALPLVGRRVGRVIEAGDLPTNAWSASGELLLDPIGANDVVLDRLAAGLAELPWSLLWLDSAPFETPRWQGLMAAVARAGFGSDCHERFRIGQVEIDHDWEGYRARWSKNHRHNMKKAVKRAEAAGQTGLVVHSRPAPDEVEGLLRQGFEIEDRGWKGAGGSSVMQSPGMFEFYCRQARQLAEWGNLHLVFLEHQGRPIAFEYGWSAKGTYYSPKVGYDEAYAELVPGQLLRLHLLERFFAEPERTLVDFFGPQVEATARWATRSYGIGRLVIAPGRMPGRAFLRAYRTCWPRVRQLRRKLGRAVSESS